MWLDLVRSYCWLFVHRWGQTSVRVRLEWLLTEPEDICMIQRLRLTSPTTRPPSACRWEPTKEPARLKHTPLWMLLLLDLFIFEFHTKTSNSICNMTNKYIYPKWGHCLVGYWNGKTMYFILEMALQYLDRVILSKARFWDLCLRDFCSTEKICAGTHQPHLLWIIHRTCWQFLRDCFLSRK